MQREEKEINSPSLLVCYVRGLGDSPCDATICLGDEIYARWSVNIRGSSSFITIMDWLGEGVTTQASRKRESRKQMLTEPLGQHLPTGLRGWREGSSHKTSHPPASPVLLTHTWGSHMEISVNVHSGFRPINQPCLVAPTMGLFWCREDRPWTLQGSQAKKTEMNGMNKYRSTHWQEAFCGWLGGGLINFLELSMIKYYEQKELIVVPYHYGSYTSQIKMSAEPHSSRKLQQRVLPGLFLSSGSLLAISHLPWLMTA